MFEIRAFDLCEPGVFELDVWQLQLKSYNGQYTHYISDFSIDHIEKKILHYFYGNFPP